MNFRENLTKLRLERHITQKELAEKMNVSLDTVVQWENGNTEPPIKDLVAISDVLGVSVDFLLGKETEDSKAEESEEIIICPCCGREVKGSLCLTCEFPVTGYQEKGPAYAIVLEDLRNGNDYYDQRAELIKYCGTEDSAIDNFVGKNKRGVIRRGLTDVAARWIASRLNPKHFDIKIVEDLGEEDEVLLTKPKVMTKPEYAYKSSGPGVGEIIIIVVLTLIVLSFL
ncbi:MAG: helix-turn-helix transcriptional regulator [Firmicutes bacterium]|nr:helix-turn-helix transcriptional regulator [Bacillota bacterium]